MARSAPGQPILTQLGQKTSAPLGADLSERGGAGRSWCEGAESGLFPEALGLRPGEEASPEDTHINF